MASFLTSSVGRKFTMALTGFFLMIFLFIHLSVNLLLFAGDTDCDGNILAKEEILFNQGSHFMATNPVIFVMQFILAAGFIYHIILGLILSLKNQKARGNQHYAMSNFAVNTPFASRTMIYSGGVILLFLILHMIDFLIPIKTGAVEELLGGDYELVTTKFAHPIYTIIYVIAFIVLGIHLSHGFSSAFQSTGMNHKKYNPIIKKIGIVYFSFISLGFSAIAIYFYFKGL